MPTIVTLSGISMPVSASHARKTESPIAVIPSGRNISFRFLHKWNALSHTCRDISVESNRALSVEIGVADDRKAGTERIFCGRRHHLASVGGSIKYLVAGNIAALGNDDDGPETRIVLQFHGRRTGGGRRILSDGEPQRFGMRRTGGRNRKPFPVVRGNRDVVLYVRFYPNVDISSCSADRIR